MTLKFYTSQAGTEIEVIDGNGSHVAATIQDERAGKYVATFSNITANYSFQVNAENDKISGGQVIEG